MMAKVCSAAVRGIEAYPVEVEVNAGYGDTLIVMVGLPDMTMKKLLPAQAMDTCRLSRMRKTTHGHFETVSGKRGRDHRGSQPPTKKDMTTR